MCCHIELDRGTLILVHHIQVQLQFQWWGFPTFQKLRLPTDVAHILEQARKFPPLEEPMHLATAFPHLLRTSLEPYNRLIDKRIGVLNQYARQLGYHPIPIV